MSDLRVSLDALLASKPGVMIARLDGQIRLDASPFVTRGPWVCVEFEDGERFAIWKYTGAVYSVGVDGAVADDPIPGYAEAAG